MLLNALNSTRYYVGSYLSDARFSPSKVVNENGPWPPLLLPAETAHGPPSLIPWTQMASGGPGAPSVLCKGSIAGGDFAAK